ncbi:unnamed protein product [Ectocarpus sp. CCAP 1310/34]|nr:unnamed protein product [Ectocarpus sp. CCAP 1310/34]
MSTSDSGSVGGLGEETSATQQQHAEDPAIARLEGQLSQLMSVVMELKRKEPGDAVAGDASRGSGAAVPSQREALPPGGGGAFPWETARDGRNHPRESRWDNIPGASPGVPARVKTGWASRSGANPEGPAGMSPGVGPDRGEARGLTPQGLDGQLIGNAEKHAPVGDPNRPSSELYSLGYTSDEVQRGLQAFHFVTTAIVREADKAIVNKCETAKEILAELDKVHNPESQGSKQALMKKMFRFTIPAHSNSNPVEHLYTLELLYSRLREKGLNADTPFVLAHFVDALPPEYQQAKFLLETATTLDRGEIIRVVSTVHASLPEGRRATKGQRKAEHAFLANDGGNRGGAPGRSSGGHSKGGGGGGSQKGKGGGRKGGGGGNSGGGGGGAGSMHGRCFRCGEKGHQAAACTKPEPLRCEKCLGYGHDKSKCSSEQAVLAVELPVLDATALDVAEEALVVRDFTGEWNRVVDRGGVEQARQERFVADTGATNHMFPSANAFENYHECDRRLSVAAGKQAFAIVGYGDVRVTIGSRVGTTDLLLKRVAHVPELNYNLVSLTALLKQTKGRLAADERELEVFVGGGESVYFPLWGDLFVQTGHRIDSGRELACAIIAPGNAKANRTPVDINDFHCAHGHSHEVLLKNTAKQQGVTLVGQLRECMGCSTAKGLSKPIPNRTSTRAPLPPIAEEDEELTTGEHEGGEGASCHGGGRAEGEPEDGGFHLDTTANPGPAEPPARDAPAAPPAAPQESGAGDDGDGAPSSREGASVAPSTTSTGMADVGGGEDDRRSSSSRGGGSSSSSSSSSSGSGSDSGSDTDIPALRGPEGRKLARFGEPAELTSRRLRENPRRNTRYESSPSPTNAEGLLARHASEAGLPILPINSTTEHTHWMIACVVDVVEELEARAVQALLCERAEEANIARQEAEDFLLGAEDLVLNSPDAFARALASTELSTESPIGKRPKRDDESGGEWPVREAIGSMMWVSTFSRPDISFAVRAVARHAHAPAERHWKAIVKILAYLKETRDLGITYKRGSGLGLEVYVDASYADAEDRRSVSGLATTVGGTVISHGSKTQAIVSLSSTEAEYIAAGEGVKEALFVRAVLSFIAPETSGSSIQVLEDNQGAMALVQNPLSSARSKHIDVRYHFIRGLFRSGEISIKFVSTSEQHADMLTKALSKSSLQYHRRKLMNLPE